MHYVGWVDVLMSWVSVLVVVFILLIASVMFPSSFGDVSLSSTLCIDALKDATFFHRVVRLGMKLAWSFQGLVVVFLIVSSPVGALDCVHLVIIVTRSLASEVIVVVTTPIPSFSVVAVIAAPRVSVVETSTAVVLSRGLLDSSDVVSDEPFCVVGVSVIFGRGEEFSDCGRPLA